MSILEVQKEMLAEQILFYILHNNVIPTSEQIVQILKDRTRELDLNQPQSSQPVTQFAYREESSAKKINTLSRKVWDDLEVLYRALDYTERENARLSSTILTRLDLLSRRCSEMIARADRLLLTSENTAGLLNAVGDEFTDGSKVDTEETTALLDLEGGSVHNQYLRPEALISQDSYDLSRLRNRDVVTSILTAFTSPTPGTRDSQNTYLISGDARSWIYTVTSDRQNPVSIAVQIDFQNCLNGADYLKTRKITLSPFIVNNSVRVLLQYSKDKVSWLEIPSENPQRQIAGPTVFLTEEFEFKYLRIMMTKTHHTRLSQNGKYIHDFGIKELKISNVLNFYERESVFQSKVLSVDNITKASLSVACENIPTETSIDYYISFVVDGTTTEEQRVTPLNRDDLTSALTAEIGGIVPASSESAINLEDREFDGAQNPDLFTLDALATDAVRIWRNVGIKGALYSVRASDNRVTEAGWNYTDGTYSCYVQIIDPAGLTIDVGGSPIKIDGLPFSGRVTLSKGNHKVEIQERNWYSLEGLYRVTEFDPITKTFKGRQKKYGDRGFTLSREEGPESIVNYNVVDPLYPYNQKLLIEGLDYQAGFNSPEGRIYQGVSRFAAELPNQVALNLLENSDASQRDMFSIVQGRTEEAVSKFAVKWSAFNDENPRELFVIETLTGDRAQGVILRAVLKTTNPKKSPSLDGYEIRTI